ncbi:MAG: hypothetical protein MJB57_18610 [Gemmatimonadetes bacterium]|nr:hypothetical protein [Gemmatimonadota bacterium]
MRRRRGARAAGRTSLVAAGVWALAVTPAMGQLRLGGQASQASETGFGVGPRVSLDLGPFDAGLRVSADFLYFFPGDEELQDIIDEFAVEGEVLEGDVDYWEANLNAHYTLGLPVFPLVPYFGGGVNFASTTIRNSTDGLVDVDRTDTGVNLLAGAQLDLAGISPFVELRYALAGGRGVTARGLDGNQWLIVGGILF